MSNEEVEETNEEVDLVDVLNTEEVEVDANTVRILHSVGASHRQCILVTHEHSMLEASTEEVGKRINKDVFYYNTVAGLYYRTLVTWTDKDGKEHSAWDRKVIPTALAPTMQSLMKEFLRTRDKNTKVLTSKLLDPKEKRQDIKEQRIKLFVTGEGEAIEEGRPNRPSLFEDSILVIEDSHIGIGKEGHLSMIKAIDRTPYPDDRTLIYQQSTLTIPQMVEPYLHVIDWCPPDEFDIQNLILAASHKYKLDITEENIDERCTNLVPTLQGLTSTEITNVLHSMAVEEGCVDDKALSYAHQAKALIINKSGFLQYYAPDVTMDDVCGLENVRLHLKGVKIAYQNDPKWAGMLEHPCGIILVGPPGTGKSHMAKAIAHELGFATIFFDPGKLMGSLVGETEANTRKFLAMLKTMNHVVIVIDEIEKAFSGVGGNGRSDGGVLDRMFGQMLTFMSENKNAVYFIGTANSIQNIPSAFSRKGRIDEVFFVDLPGEKSREALLNLMLGKRRQDVSTLSIPELVKASNGFAGAEIEGVIKTTIRNVIEQFDRVPTTEDFLNAFHATKSISVSKPEEVMEMRMWANEHGVPASDEDPVEIFPVRSAAEPTTSCQRNSTPAVNTTAGTASVGSGLVPTRKRTNKNTGKNPTDTPDEKAVGE